jgi:hypothetical protein
MAKNITTLLAALRAESTPRREQEAGTGPDLWQMRFTSRDPQKDPRHPRESRRIPSSAAYDRDAAR